MKDQKPTSHIIKETIRRILFFPFWLVAFPFLWILTPDSYKELWELFFEMTEVGAFSI